MNENNIIDNKSNITNKHGGARPGAGRKPTKVNWNLLTLYSQAHCSKGELAQVAKIKLEHLHKHCLQDHGISLDEWIKANELHGNAQVKRKFYKNAMLGHARALEWLRRHWLGETDKAIIDVNTKVEGRVTFTMPANGREVDMREPRKIEQGQILEHNDIE